MLGTLFEPTESQGDTVGSYPIVLWQKNSLRRVPGAQKYRSFFKENMERRGQLHGDKDQANRRRFKSKIRKGLRKETMLVSNNRCHFYAR